MANESKISTQTAILLGSVIIAAGLFFGLRGKNEAPPSLPNASVVATPQQALAQPATAQPAPAPQKKDRTAVAKEAELLLAKQKKTLTEKCLAPSLAKTAEPKNVILKLNFTFDAAGKQITRGIVEDRATSRPDVSQCVNNSLADFVVSPPGENVYVEIGLELP